MGFEARRRLAQRLRSGRMSRFTDLIGQFRQMAAWQRARRMERVPVSWSGSRPAMTSAR